MGGVLGAVLWVAVAAAFPGFLARYFPIEAGSVRDPRAGLQGVAIACPVTLLFTVPRLLAVKDTCWACSPGQAAGALARRAGAGQPAPRGSTS